MKIYEDRPVTKIGLLVGREWGFPPAFLEAVNSLDNQVVAETIELGGVKLDAPCEYTVILDRISHEVPFYRAYLKHAARQGAYVVNNPFWCSADDKFLEAGIAADLGLPVPKTALLPMKSYPAGITGDSLRNLKYPSEWQELVTYTGLPAILKDILGSGWKHVYLVETVDELIRAYDQTGQLCMMLQEYIGSGQHVRCLCVGPDVIKVWPYEPKSRSYLVEEPLWLRPVAGEIEAAARRLHHALGYDINSIEFVVRDGIPYAIDVMNPIPALDINHLTPIYFDEAVAAIAAYCVDLAIAPRAAIGPRQWIGCFEHPLDARPQLEN
jgi:glutathione synthase/RimK-type ligase-like ATP-grasp enzyme